MESEDATVMSKEATLSFRAYHSPLRQAHAEVTRQLVLDAAIDLLVEEGADALSLRAIARRAGVSAPTVSRYFPDNDALLVGLDERVTERLGITRGPRDAAEMVRAVRNVYLGMDAQERTMRAFLRAPASRALGVRRRRVWLESAFGPELADLSQADRGKVLAVLQLFYSSRTWEQFRDVWDLRGDDAASAAHWAVCALIDAAHARPPSAVPLPEPVNFDEDEEEP